MAEVTEAVKGADAEDIRSKTERLQTAFHRVSEAMYERAQAAQQAEAASSNGASSDGDASADEEVVDAEVVDEQK
jgi:molecular chaperone DnaK